MESLIGLRGKDFVMIAADSYAQFSVYRMKDDEDKIMEVDKNKLLATAGPIGDRNQFGEYIRKNIHLHRLRTGTPLCTHAAAHFTRGQLAHFLRQNPYQVDLLMGGCDEDGPVLYWMDYLSSMVSLEKAAHGYCAYFVGGLLDRYYEPNLSEEAALEIMRMCVQELKSRFILSQYDFIVKVVDKDGVRIVKL